MHAKHWVWREKHRHGKVVRVRVRVSYVKTEHRKVCTTTSPATAPTTTPTPTPAPVVTLAALDPSFTQDPMNPLAVTYHYSASATTNTGGVSVPDPALPAGILNLYNDGLLACSINVGGSVTGGNCPITTTIGAHTVVTTYISGTTSATTTDTEQINPFTTTTAVTATPDVARPCTSTTSGQYTIDQCQYLLTATTIDQNGRPLAAWETVTFTATDSTASSTPVGFRSPRERSRPSSPRQRCGHRHSWIVPLARTSSALPTGNILRAGQSPRPMPAPRPICRQRAASR